MKFFNWVHKRFHHPLPKDHYDFDNDNVINVENSHVATCDQESDRDDKDKQAMTKKAVLVDALDGWKDGILAIGTFGFDPLKPLMGNPRDYLVLHSEEDDDDTPDFSTDEDNVSDDNSEDEDDEEEENPLMFTSLGHSFKQEEARNCVEINVESLNDDDDDDDNKKIGRTTLADLFMADADQAMIKKKMMSMIGKLGSAKLADNFDGDYYDDVKYSKKMNLVGAKKGLSFAKKLIPKVKDEASPIKNIQRLMRRMLKRKIHPELLDIKSQKSDGQIGSTAIELVTVSHHNSATESVSLLAMQGVPSEA